jgi:hypothetical protein
LVGAKVLVAEDSLLIALDIELGLREQGCVVLGSTATIAATLAAMGVPFALLTADRPDALEEAVALAGVPRIMKPWHAGDVEQMVGQYSYANDIAIWGPSRPWRAARDKYLGERRRLTSLHRDERRAGRAAHQAVKKAGMALTANNIRRNLDQRFGEHRMTDCAARDFRRHLAEGFAHMAGEALSGRAKGRSSVHQFLPGENR